MEPGIQELGKLCERAGKEQVQITQLGAVDERINDFGYLRV